MTAITRKVGDTLSIGGHYRDGDGNLVDLSTAGIIIKSSLRLADGPEIRFDVHQSDQATDRGGFTLLLQTEGLQAGDYAWDVRYDQGVMSRSSPTNRITLQQGVTG